MHTHTIVCSVLFVGYAYANVCVALYVLRCFDGCVIRKLFQCVRTRIVNDTHKHVWVRFLDSQVRTAYPSIPFVRVIFQRIPGVHRPLRTRITTENTLNLFESRPYNEKQQSFIKEIILNELILMKEYLLLVQQCLQIRRQCSHGSIEIRKSKRILNKAELQNGLQEIGHNIKRTRILKITNYDINYFISCYYLLCVTLIDLWPQLEYWVKVIIK